MIKFYTTQEIAEILKVTPTTVRRYLANGRLKSIKIGKEHRISESQFKEFIDFLNGEKVTAN